MSTPSIADMRNRASCVQPPICTENGPRSSFTSRTLWYFGRTTRTSWPSAPISFGRLPATSPRPPTFASGYASADANRIFMGPRLDLHVLLKRAARGVRTARYMAGRAVVARVRTMTATRQDTEDRAHVAIREFRPEDYPGITEVCNLVDPDYPSTEAELREEDRTWDRGKFVQVRYVAEEADTGKAVALAEYNHQPWSFDPRRFSIWIGVRPDRQGRGVGGALYDRVVEDLRSHGANALRSWAREDRAESVRFLEKRGFRELERAWESRLDMKAFDPARFADRAAVPAGIDVVSLAEELARDPEVFRRVHAFGAVAGVDVPRLDPYTPPEYETWRRNLNGPWSLPGGFFLPKGT